MRRLWIVLMLLAVGACWTVVRLPWDDADALAAEGRIDERAPVKTELAIAIHAPPEKVWSVLTDVKAWPSWQPSIAETAIAGPVAPGTAFTWKTGGMVIHSRMAVVMPAAELVWSGKALGAKAIHVWRLERLPDGGTRVRMEESMDGLLIRAFYSSEKLKESDQAWLDALKAAAEKP